jgi:ferritin-like metal-binding protein YciE
MELDSLQALYVEKLRDLYSAEHQILKAMPKIRKAVTNDELMEAFDTHVAQTESQVQRLERIFEDLGVPPKGKHCKGMEGLLAEANELLGEDAEDDVLDAGIIASAQAVEHYEIAGYGTARTYSELLGFDDHTELLQQTLNEEEETDRILTEIAMTSVNLEAMDNEEGEEAGEATASRSAGRSGAKSAGKKAAAKKKR